MKKFKIKKHINEDAAAIASGGDDGRNTVISTDNISNPAYSPVSWNKSKDPDLEESWQDIDEISGGIHSSDTLPRQKLSVALSEENTDMTYGLQGDIESSNELGFKTFYGDSSNDISQYGSDKDFNSILGMDTPNSLASDIKTGYELIPNDEIEKIGGDGTMNSIQVENANITDLSHNDSRFITLFDEYLDKNNPPVLFNKQQKPYSQMLKVVDPEAYKLGQSDFINNKRYLLIDEDAIEDIKFDFQDKDGDVSSEELDLFDNPQKQEEDLTVGRLTNSDNNLINKSLNEDIESYDSQLGFNHNLDSNKENCVADSVLTSILDKAVREYKNILSLPALNNFSSQTNSYGLLRNYLIKIEQTGKGKDLLPALKVYSDLPPETLKVFSSFLNGDIDSSVAIQLFGKYQSEHLFDTPEEKKDISIQILGEDAEKVDFVKHIENMVKDLPEFEDKKEQYENYSKGLKDLLSKFEDFKSDPKLEQEVSQVVNDEIKEILSLLKDGTISKDEAFDKLIDISKNGNNKEVEEVVEESNPSNGQVQEIKVDTDNPVTVHNVSANEVAAAQSTQIKESLDMAHKKLTESLESKVFAGNFYEVRNAQNKFIDFGMAKSVTETSVKINSKEYPLKNHTFFGFKGW